MFCNVLQIYHAVMLLHSQDIGEPLTRPNIARLICVGICSSTIYYIILMVSSLWLWVCLWSWLQSQFVEIYEMLIEMRFLNGPPYDHTTILVIYSIILNWFNTLSQEIFFEESRWELWLLNILKILVKCSKFCTRAGGDMSIRCPYILLLKIYVLIISRSISDILC